MSGPLATAFRAKYPGSYDAVPDDELEQAIVAKYPGSYDHLVEKKAPAPAPAVAPPLRQWTGLQKGIDAIDAPGGSLPRVRGFVAGSVQAAADLAEAAKAGVASTVFHGGDLIRRMTGAERIIDRPEVQAAITPPNTAAGKVGFALEQGAEFAVPLTKLTKLAKGMGLGRRVAIDAAASAGVAGVQSGGDGNTMILGGVLGGAVPVVGGGLRLVGGAVKRGAAGAAEGGVGGAIASAVRSTAPLDSNFMLFQGLKPRNTKTQFMTTLARAVPEIKASEAELGKAIENIDDLLKATGLAKKRIRGQYDEIAGAKRAIGTTVDLTAMADEMVARIPKKLRLEDPTRAEAIEGVAAQYRRAFPLEEAEQLLKETNGELEAFYNKFPMGQRKALVSDPEAARLDAQAKGLRDAIYATLDGPNQPAGARALNRLYGNLLEIEDTAVRRSNVAKRQQPESLNEQFSKAKAAGDMARGAWRIARGDLSGAADIVAGVATRDTAKFLKDQQTTDALIRRAFAGVKDKPGVYAKPVPRPVRGLLEKGSTPMPASTADASGPIPPTLPENIHRPRVETDADGVVPDFDLPDAPAGNPDLERSFMLRWLADDLDEMPFEKGGSTRQQRIDAAENWRPGDPEHLKHGYVPAGHVAGTPTQEMFHAIGIKGSRGQISKKLSTAVKGGKADPKLEALADAMREAWDGKGFDWQLVSDETIAKLGIRRRDFRSPITLPSQDDMPGMFTKLFGGAE